MITKHDPALVKSMIVSSQKILIPIIRKILPATLAQEILGVLPMTGPAGKIFTLRANYNRKPKYNFSRAKWYEADREMVKTKSAFVSYNQEQFVWCMEQFGLPPVNPDAWCRWYVFENRRYRFRDEKDYIWFMLRWS